MKIVSKRVLSFALVSTALWAAPSFAQGMGGASEGTGEAPRGAELSEVEVHSPAPMPPKTVEGEMRAAPMDDAATLLKSMSSVTRSRDGKENVAPPSDAVKRAVEEELKAPAGDKAQAPERKADDPALSEGEGERAVLGGDDRVQVKNTQSYPFRVIGYIEGKGKSGNYMQCTATLIGPRTVLTAAQCLYVHDDGGWYDEFVFVPGFAGQNSKGENIMPYGAFAYESASIMQGYIDNYKSAYGDVLLWDLGILTLAEPVGDSLGWLGYANYDDLGDFNANVVTYPNDKPFGTMWRGTCDVTAEQLDEAYFTHKCDIGGGGSGAAMYIYNEQTKDRITVGVTVAEGTDVNYAVRLNQSNVEWINSLWK